MTSRYTIERLETVERLWARLDGRVREIERAMGIALPTVSLAATSPSSEDAALEGRIKRCEQGLSEWLASGGTVVTQNEEFDSEVLAIGLAAIAPTVEETPPTEVVPLPANDGRTEAAALLIGLAMGG